MHIEIFGLDKYVVATLSEQLHLPLIKLTKVNEKDLFFSVFESMIFHRGVDQNAWHTVIRIFLVETDMKYQEELKALFIEALKDEMALQEKAGINKRKFANKLNRALQFHIDK